MPWHACAASSRLQDLRRTGFGLKSSIRNNMLSIRLDNTPDGSTSLSAVECLMPKINLRNPRTCRNIVAAVTLLMVMIGCSCILFTRADWSAGVALVISGAGFFSGADADLTQLQ